MQDQPTQQKHKNAATCPDSAVAAALAAKTPWAAIVKELHVGPGRISRIARGGSTRGSSGSRSRSGSDSEGVVVALKAKLVFMNEFFKANAKYLFANTDIATFIENHPEFDEVDKSCQA